MIDFHDRVPDDERGALLDEISQGSPMVQVEYSPWRQLNDSKTVVGTLLGTAWTSMGTTDVLMVRPMSPRQPHPRLMALSVAHVLRIRSVEVTAVARGTGEATWRLGGVLADLWALTTSQPIPQERMQHGLCPECGGPVAVHSNDRRYWMPRSCDLTAQGVRDRIAQYVADRAG